MRKYLIIAILISFGLHSQNDLCGRITYSESFVNSTVFHYELNFDNSESIYTAIKDNNASKEIETIGGFVPQYIPFVYYYNSKTNEFIFQEDVAFSKAIVKENFCELEWNITEETKKIGSFNCYKALLTFRGINYIAWFTPEIPVPYGPWKFRGLNGLILEVYDEGVNFRVLANDVHIPIDCSTKAEIVSKNSLKNPIDWSEYVLLKRSEAEDIEELFNSKLERGQNNVGVTIDGFVKEIIN